MSDVPDAGARHRSLRRGVLKIKYVSHSNFFKIHIDVYSIECKRPAENRHKALCDGRCEANERAPTLRNCPTSSWAPCLVWNRNLKEPTDASARRRAGKNETSKRTVTTRAIQNQLKNLMQGWHSAADRNRAQRVERVEVIRVLWIQRHVRPKLGATGG